MRLVVLAFYTVYALSPLYMSKPDQAGITAPVQENLTVGIVWVSVLLDSITGEDVTAGPVRDSEAVQDSQDDDMVLVKKKRSVFREPFTIHPAPQVLTALLAPEKPIIFPSSSGYEVPLDLIHGNSDGYYSLCTGLSPPVLS